VFVNADANHSISRRDSTSEDSEDSLAFDMPVPKPKTLMVGLTSYQRPAATQGHWRIIAIGWMSSFLG